MKTPIWDFVRRYADAGDVRLHMPGHKGRPFLGCECYDVTEIDGADLLSDAKGIILESEQNASSLFGTAHSFYSTEGSTLCIKAMLSLATQGKKPLVLAARNAHRAFLSAAALLDLDVEWIYPQDGSHLCECNITPKDLEDALQTMEALPSAVYVTSPDYLGNLLDVAGLSAVCNAHGIPLLVDNAHGAYLAFASPSLHPIALGASMCCDSAHKTLSSLTGGAYLHVSKEAPREYLQNAREALSLFASSSPSYLILASLDLCNANLADGYRQRLTERIGEMDALKRNLTKHGLCVKESEPLKLVLEANAFGYTGEEIAEHLKKHGIFIEFYDREYAVMMLSTENSVKDLKRLKSALCTLKPKARISQEITGLPPKTKPAMRIREALLSAKETVAVTDAEGRISASAAVSCPPAIPIVLCGERITKEHIRLLAAYGTERISVVKE